MMKGIFLNIIKLFISIVLQCYMILACPTFLSYGWDYKDIIAKVITLLGVFLGEWGIYLIYTVKPLKNKKQNSVYTKIYIGINIVLFGILLYAYVRQGYTHNSF